MSKAAYRHHLPPSHSLNSYLQTLEINLCMCVYLYYVTCCE